MRPSQEDWNPPAVDDSKWPAMTHPVVGCMACQFDRQVYGIEIEFV
jgi:hypothetical protein